MRKIEIIEIDEQWARALTEGSLDGEQKVLRSRGDHSS